MARVSDRHDHLRAFEVESRRAGHWHMRLRLRHARVRRVPRDRARGLRAAAAHLLERLRDAHVAGPIRTVLECVRLRADKRPEMEK